MHSPVYRTSHCSTAEHTQIPLQFLPNFPIGHFASDHNAVIVFQPDV